MEDALVRLNQESELERIHRVVQVSGTSGTAVTTDFVAARQLALRPVVIGRGNDCRCIVVRDQFAYVGVAGGGVAVLDVSDPTQPAMIGGIQNPNCEPVSFALAGNMLYAADRTAGLFALDISNPRRPTVTATHPALVHTNNRRVLVSGSTLVLLNEHAFSVFDISSPTQPRPLAYHHRMRSGVGWFRGAAFVDTQLLVTQGVLGLWVFDLATPAVPRALVGAGVSLDTRPNERLVADSLAIYGGRAFVGTSSGVWALRLHSDAPPQSEAFFTGPGYIRDVVQGDARANLLHFGVFEPHDHAFYVFDVSQGPRYLGRQRLNRAVERIWGFQFAANCTLAAAGVHGVLVTSF